MQHLLSENATDIQSVYPNKLAIFRKAQLNIFNISIFLRLEPDWRSCIWRRNHVYI